jgi:ankyrin repeat protein
MKKLLHLIVGLGISSAFAGSYEDFFSAIERDPKGQTGLFLALQGGSLQAAEPLVLDRTLDVDALNESGESALMMAALKGRLDWVQRLLDRGAQVDKSGWTPLHYAATGPEPAVVRLLLDRGAKIDAGSPNRSTPLMMAAQYGNPASVDLLLARGADPRLKNDQGLTAADFARLADRQALAERLATLAR